MKKRQKIVFRIVVLAVVLMFTMTGCPDPTSDGGDTTQTPVVDDFTVSNNTQQTAGSVSAVTVTAKAGRTTGKVTVYYMGSSYAKNTAVPQTAGTYAVTFDVAAAAGWNAVSGLSAGILTITDPSKQNPTADDYSIVGSFSQTAGSVSTITVTPKSGKSGGAVTVYYTGTGGTAYPQSQTVPQTAGTYTVTFDVAAAGDWYGVTGLSAGTLTVNTKSTPTAADYIISNNLSQTAGSVSAITVTVQAGKSAGAVTVYYTGTGSTTYAKNTAVPQTAGTYAVTFDVAAAGNWNAAAGLSAGTLIVAKQTPTADDYSIVGNFWQTAGSVSAITVTPKSGSSSGAVTVYYTGTGSTTYAKNTAVPQTAGTYAVTFDVAAAGDWNGATGLSAGTLTINTKSTPTAADYTISGNLSQTAGSVTAVTITPKSGKSGGAVTVYYTGTGGTAYPQSQTVPQTAGTYAVTFDVAAAGDWNAASGLSAGNYLVVLSAKSTPVAADYTVSDNLSQTAGSVSPVTVTVQAGKSGGAVTVYYTGTGSTTYARSQTVPQTAGTYAVTFDVAAAGDWSAATGLSAGTLTVKSTPTANDYIFDNLLQTAGGVTAVTVRPKPGKSDGAVTVYYTGTGSTTYTKSEAVPEAAGTYAVTFDVAEVGNWYGATGLSAGTLTIGKATPTADDYTISGNLSQTVGSVSAITVTVQAGKSAGAVTVYYTGTGSTTYAKNTAVPEAAGTYAVTFDVAAAYDWNAAAGLSAGTLTIGKVTPTADDYTISGNFSQTVGSVTAITVTPKSGSSTGAVTVYYTGTGGTYPKSATVPPTAGTYAVTFDVEEVANWYGVTGLSAGTLTIGKATPTADDYTINNLSQIASSISAVTVTAKPGKSEGTVTVYYIGTGSTTYAKSQAVPQTAGTYGTYAVTFDVAAAGDWNAASGLSAGTLTIDTGDGNSPSSPKTKIYTTNNIDQQWGAINAAIKNAGKYVILDLSAASFTGNTIGNDMNVIYDNQYIKGIILPDTLQTIGDYAFYGCSGLTSVTIPSSVASIGVSAFKDCSGLTSVTIPSSVASIGASAFEGCSGLTGNLTIPAGVTSIGGQAFYDCSGLTSVTIPASVTSIGDYAFAFCSGLTSVTFGTGSNIGSSRANFGSRAFPTDDFNLGDYLRAMYLATGGGAGTYTRDAGGNIWEKQ